MFPNDYSNLYRNLIMAPAALHNLPAIYPFREYPKFWGGLISYGVNTNYLYQGEASYVDRIIRGESPATSRSRNPPSLSW